MRMPEPGVQRQVEPEEEEETLQSKPLANQITPLVQVQRLLDWFKGRSSQKRRKKNFKQKQLQAVSLKLIPISNLISSLSKEEASLYQKTTAPISSRA